ncbi:MFS transporter [Nocardiopsis ganjiahuensis]|uniref:MFS transporter n=1 Tax=Nocardiopsis ganjiahuensis TaxID=239984 RepID=UPI00034D0F2C|nr:MFS transporter [Nocardiopsis ganjiahuensis]
MSAVPPSSPTPASPPPRLDAAFHRFWAGSVVSNLADGVMLTALPLLAAVLTSDPLAVAGLTVARYLPWLLFGLVAGVWVDRGDRVRMMVAANLVRAAAIVALAVLVATGQAGIAWLYVVMFAVMTCEIVYDVAARAMVPSLARGAVDQANGRLVSGREVAQEFVGAPLGGFLFVVAAFLPLAVNAGAYVVGAVVLLGLPLAVRGPGARAAREGGGVRARRGSVGADLAEGVRHVWGDVSLRALVVFSSVSNLGAGALMGVFVLVVQVHFGVPGPLFGVFLAVAAVGAIGGALSASWARERWGRFAVVVAGFLGQAGWCAVFALAPNAWVAALAWAGVAASGTVAVVLLAGIVQQVVPERLMGRVLSVKKMSGMGLVAVGALVGGLLGRVHLMAPAWFGVVVFVGATVWVWGRLREGAARADEAERLARRGG